MGQWQEFLDQFGFCLLAGAKPHHPGHHDWVHNQPLYTKGLQTLANGIDDLIGQHTGLHGVDRKITHHSVELKGNELSR